MKEKNNGMGLVSILTIVFVVLKLCKVINWSWWWVLSPLWIDLCIVVIAIVIVTIINGIRK